MNLWEGNKMGVRRYVKGFAVLVFATFLLGVASMASAALRIAVVDVRRAVSESSAGKSARNVLQREAKGLQSRFDSKKGDLEKEVETIRNLQREIEQKGAIWRPEERDKKELELRDRRRNFSRQEDDLKRFAQESRRDMELRKQRVMGNILKEMRDVVQAVAREGKYDLVVDKTVGGVLFVKKEVDITDQVIKLYNQKKK